LGEDMLLAGALYISIYFNRSYIVQTLTVGSTKIASYALLCEYCTNLPPWSQNPSYAPV